MAQLLGSRYCIDSLRSDVADLQTSIVDISSRVGPVRYPSWKYPDRKSIDVDVKELLKEHDYSEDVEERQVAHVVLLELVIDRYVAHAHTSIFSLRLAFLLVFTLHAFNEQKNYVCCICYYGQYDNSMNNDIVLIKIL